MKHQPARGLLCLLGFGVFFGGCFEGSAADGDLSLTRGPYLQLGTPTAITVRWRTDLAGNSRVQYGTNASVLDGMAEDTTETTEHEVRLTGLQPNTRYWYAVESGSQVLAGGTNYYFLTAPTNNKAIRIWVTGDTRAGDSMQGMVRDAYYSYCDRNTDFWLMLGDYAESGTDEGLSKCLFNFYPERLRQTAVWPCIGNHEVDWDGATSYLDAFTLPTNGEGGGIGSGTELYYSFNYGNIHFVVLDPVTSDLSVGGAMYNWLQRDLDANIREWLIAFFHYPPYSKGGHDSDYEQGMILVRENFLPVLEGFGVDLVLSGHSHTYERSYLLDSFYGYSWEMQEQNVKDYGDGRADGSGAYMKSAGLNPHEGTVYVVAGSSGLTSGVEEGHPAMFLSENEMGSLILDINRNVLQAVFLRETGAIDDYFTIIKGTPPVPIRISQVIAENGVVTVAWNSVSGRSYQVERKAMLQRSTTWESVSPILQPTDASMSWTDDTPPQPTAFYRIVEISN